MSFVFNPFTGEKDVTGDAETDPLSLHLDQTEPQTITGLADGFLKIDSGVIGTGEVDLSTKEDVGVAAGLDADHLEDYDHTLIATAVQTEEDPVFTGHPAYGLTSEDMTDIGNLSGENTGDQTLPTRDSLGLDTDDTVTFANLSGTNTGDQTIYDIHGITLDNGNEYIGTGIKGYFTIPYACTIVGWTITSVLDVTGSVVFDIWKANAAIPTVANTITASAKPTLSSGVLASSATLTGWTTSIAAGDVLAYNVDSISLLKKVTLGIKVAKG
jgi:hypothetical protein